MVCLLKDIVKTLEILFLGLVVAVFVYPFSHELGHSIFAFLSGTKVFEFTIFPVPSILCNMSDASVLQYLLIGLGGMVFPLIVSVAFHPKHFVWWYIDFVVKVISIIAFGISIVGIIMYKTNVPIKNEDITTTLLAVPDLWVSLLLLCILAELILILSIIKSQPIKHIEKFYGI